VARCLLVLGIGSSGLCWAGPAHADEEPTIDAVKYDPSELPPEGTGGRLMLAGALLTVGWYGASVGTSYIWQDAPNARDLRLPVVGPWLSLRNVGCGDVETGCSRGTVILRTALAVVSGVGQFGGLLAFTEGIFADTASSAAPGSDAPKKAALASPPDMSARQAAATSSWLATPVPLPEAAVVEWVGHF
jgi:hypothetical protein